MVRPGRKIVNWLYVAAQPVGDDDTRVAEPSRQPAQEPLCCLRVAARLHRNVEDISCRVDRLPEPVFATADQDDHLVQMPFVARTRAIPLDAVGKVPAKPVDPLPDAFPTDKDAALGEQVLDIGSAQGKPVIGPNSRGYDLARETKAFQARHGNGYLHPATIAIRYRKDNLAIPLSKHRPYHGKLNCRVKIAVDKMWKYLLGKTTVTLDYYFLNGLHGIDATRIE